MQPPCYVSCSLLFLSQISQVASPFETNLVFQRQDSGLRSKVDEHPELAVSQFDGQEVCHVLDEVVGIRSDVEQQSFLHLRVEHQGQVGVGAGREALVPGPALTVVGRC